VPDIVLYPENEEDVIHLVKAAGKHNVSIIPYGGGTNVSEALECPHDELRMIASVDMRQMNRVLWYDPVNRMAAIESGAVGRHIVKELAKYGYTIGQYVFCSYEILYETDFVTYHSEPDSIEFSTLGGWIATNASGMKKNKYGNIEDIVLDINVITSMGRLERTAALPRESVGIDMRRLLFGSEGNLGIITSAVIKIFPLPEVQQYGSILFPSFEKGVAFMYELTQRGGQPASIRLVDNTQFQFSMALKPASTGVKAVMGRLQKEYVTRIRGFDSRKMVACTLVLEGRADEVKYQESVIYALAAKHKGLKAGSENGERGYLLTYNIAYIRDFGIDHYIIAESFETSVPWSRTLELCQRTKARVFKEHAQRKLPGKPFVTCRVTQVYESGVAVYFYLAFFFQNVEDPSGIYAEIEKAARDEILLCGGALSHHHGVGKLRKGFLDRIMSQEALEWRKKLKSSVDPSNIFGAGNFTT
jgi:alkyldihydroxyacetonephosphate synthase